MNTVLFACVHNAGRSQMAAAWFNALGDPEQARSISAGTEPGARVHPEVLEVMREVGIDLSCAAPQFLSDELARSAQLLVTMGCGEACPALPGLRRADWPLEDPKGKPLTRVREIRDEVRDRVQQLLAAEGWARHSFRIALGNVRFPDTAEHSIELTAQAIERASGAGAQIICFPECLVPGYRALGRGMAPPNPEFLERAWATLAEAAAKAGITVVLGTERFVAGRLVATVLVIHSNGTRAGFQDKVQIDPSEEGTYSPGSGRQIFRAGALTFGVVICHEGWRYPETVRWAARRGAHVVFHPQFHEAEPGSFRPATFGDPANSFHEKAALCRAAENTCYFATANYASTGSPTTSAIIRPDGTLLSYQPYGEEGVLVGDLDLRAATGLLAARYQPLT
jgi:predicted amidohydrolase/protein-tyrosine-phosphatase